MLVNCAQQKSILLDFFKWQTVDMYVCVFCFIFIFKNSLNVESSHMCNLSNCEENTSDNAIYHIYYEILVQMFSNLVPNVRLCDFVFFNKSHVLC